MLRLLKLDLPMVGAAASGCAAAFGAVQSVSPTEQRLHHQELHAWGDVISAAMLICV